MKGLCILWVSVYVRAYECASESSEDADTKNEGNRGDVREDRDREATAEFAILPTALIRREIRSSMVKQLASSPDHMKPSTPSSFSFFSGYILFPPSFTLSVYFLAISTPCSLLHFRG